jgi:predicted TPR repeat methyltransferase
MEHRWQRMSPTPEHQAESSLQEDELSLPDALRQAVLWHREGQVHAAAEIYRRILEQVPDHPEALHFQGVALHQLGRSEEGLVSIRRAVALAADYVAAYNNLGNVLKEKGRTGEAEEAYRRVIALEPRNGDGFNNLGVVLKEQGRLEEALNAYQQAIALEPRHADAWHNLGNVLKKLNRIEEALDAYRQAITLRPYHTEAYKNLGRMLYLAGRISEAAEVYRTWLGRNPGNPVARHMLSACSGEDVPPRASDDYVVLTFDNFAATFDEVLARLDYRAPMLVSEAVKRAIGEPGGTLAVLDVGCGSGLCGPLLRPYAKRLTGVDLSLRMLDKASGRDVYDDLIQAELTAYLVANPGQFDLIAAADTLCYFGELGPVTFASARALRPGGWFLFTVEAALNELSEGFCIQPHGRYSHTAEYVRSLLITAGFQFVGVEQAVLRSEGGKPAVGLIVSAQCC